MDGITTAGDSIYSSILTQDTGATNNTNTGAIDQRFAQLMADDKDAANDLADITKGGASGYWGWKVKEMKKQITDDVMNSMNLTPDKIAGMDTAQRVDTEAKVMKTVQDRLKLAIDETMKKKQNNLVASSPSLQSIIRNTQDVSVI